MFLRIDPFLALLQGLVFECRRLDFSFFHLLGCFLGLALLCSWHFCSSWFLGDHFKCKASTFDLSTRICVLPMKTQYELQFWGLEKCSRRGPKWCLWGPLAWLENPIQSPGYCESDNFWKATCCEVRECVFGSKSRFKGVLRREKHAMCEYHMFLHMKRSCAVWCSCVVTWILGVVGACLNPFKRGGASCSRNYRVRGTPLGPVSYTHLTLPTILLV